MGAVLVRLLHLRAKPRLTGSARQALGVPHDELSVQNTPLVRFEQ